MLRIGSFFLFVVYEVLLNPPKEGKTGTLLKNWLVQTSTTNTESTCHESFV